MKSRYEEPDEPSPDPLLSNHYLWLADQKNGASEDERMTARMALLTVYQMQREEMSKGQRANIDPGILPFSAMNFSVARRNPIRLVP